MMCVICIVFSKTHTHGWDERNGEVRPAMRTRRFQKSAFASIYYLDEIGNSVRRSRIYTESNKVLLISP